MQPLLAKSRDYGGTTLLEHTRHVVAAIEVMANAWDFEVLAARNGAILHDLGKAHPHFQNKIHKLNARTLNQQQADDYAHRHEFSSLAFLPLFPNEDWNILIELVVAHHKPIEGDTRGRGLLDLHDTDSRLIANHLKDWETWSPQALEIAQAFGLPIRPIPRQEAVRALLYSIDYCYKRTLNWSPWRGLLQAADHFASALVEKTRDSLPRLFQSPNLLFFNASDRRSSLFPLSKLPTEDLRPHTLVVAPTGAGKTDFLMRRCRHRVFYTLPYQASINAMHARMKAAMPGTDDVRVLHATSRIVAKGDEEAQILQPFAGAALKVLTPHQLASVVFGTAGFEAVMLDVRGNDVILDEIHTYADHAQAMVLELVRTLVRLGCRVHVGTATMPTKLYEEVLRLLGGPDCVYEVRLSNTILDTFDRHIVHKLPSDAGLAALLEKAFEEKEKVLLVYNTVTEAQTQYERWNRHFPDIGMMLIHSRFRRGDRVELERKLKENFNGATRANPEGTRPCLVVATQVVEVSLDISFDRLITEAAPLDALVQRFGRINRRRTEQTKRILKPVHVLSPAPRTKPYDKKIVEDSYRQLPDNECLTERSIQARMDAVYPTLLLRPIDMHLLVNEQGYTLKELCNRPRSTLLDALEIEAATCILEQDRSAYETGNWETRLSLEIPVSWRVIAPHRTNYVQLDIGSNPFVVPQAWPDYKQVGLRLVEPDCFL